MLRSILENTTFQLKAWIEQKNFAAKMKAGQRGNMKEGGFGFRDGEEDLYADLLFAPGTEVRTLKTQDGNLNYAVTYTPHDDVAKRFLSVKQKVAEIRKLQALLGDIAEEMTAGYLQMKMMDGKGVSINIMVIDTPVKEVGDRNARRARLGLMPV